MESIAIQTSRDSIESDRSARQGNFFRMLSAGRRELLFWALQLSFWTILGGIGLLMTMAFQSAIPGVGWVVFMRMATGFAQTSAMRWIYRSSHFRHRSGIAKWPLVFGCCLAFALLELVIIHALVVAGVSFPGGSVLLSAKLLIVRFFILSIWSTLYFGFHLLENEHALELRATKAELTARENELRAVQARLAPHFLFNALNAVMDHREDPHAVKDLTRSLSEYLRFLLQDARPLEPLSREIDALEKYLTVQTSHFGGKLVCRIQCERAARAVMVPPMMVQPLLEDAFRHRSQTDELPLQIWLTARLEDGFLRVTVSNTGEQQPSDSSLPPDTGITALRQQLHLLLGQRARVERQADNGWLRVTIHIPLPASPAPRAS